MKETKPSNPKRKFSDVTQSDPTARESFSQFEKNDDGTEIPHFEINKIETIHYLLDYLSFNSEVKTLTVEVDSQVNEAACLLACNNTLTRLTLYAAGDMKEPLDQGLVALASHPSLTHLHIKLRNGSISLEGINQLLQNKILRTFELFSDQQKYHEIARILSSHPSLENLSLGGNITSKACRYLSKGHFSRLNISSGSLGNDGVRILSGHPGLTSLDLNHSQINNDGAALLLKLNALKVLNLAYNKKIDDQGIDFISKHPNINELTLSGPNISLKGIELFLKMKKKVLKRFTFFGPLNDDAKGNDLARSFSDCPALIRLELTSCKIGPEGAAFISKNQNLEHLDLSHNPLKNEGAYHLSIHPRLNSLYLENCRIGDYGVIALTSNPNINRLVLNRNIITHEGVFAIAFSQTITELNFEYYHKIDFQFAWSILAGNQMLRFLHLPGKIANFENDPLIQLGGRNFRLQKQLDNTVVNDIFFHYTPLLKVIIAIVLDYAKPAYPYQYGLFNKSLTPENRELNCLLLHTVKRSFRDHKKGVLFWDGMTPKACSQIEQMLPRMEQNCIALEKGLS